MGYTIWYIGTKHGLTINMGTASGKSFQEACDKLFDNEEDRGYYNRDKITYYGHKLFYN